MKAVLDRQDTIVVGTPTLLESSSPTAPFAVMFEDEGDTGYFYALETELEQPIADALHIYDVSNVKDGHHPSEVKIAWSRDGLKAAVLINDYVHAVFNFESKQGFCRSGFPPPEAQWSVLGHEWNDEAYNLFN